MNKFTIGATATGVAIAANIFMFASAQTPVATTPPANPHEFRLEIGPRGNAFLRGTLVSVGSSSVIVKTWGGNWTILVSQETEILPRITGAISDISYFETGDYIGVQGAVDTSLPFTIHAKVLRDRTERQERHDNLQQVRDIQQAGKENGVGRVFEGIGSNIGSNSLTLSAENKTFTVVPTADVQILNRNWLNLSFSSIQNGDKIRVFGSAVSGTITASVIRDVSVPR